MKPGGVALDRVHVPFQDQGLLYYLTSGNPSQASPFYVADALNVLLKPEAYTIDLSGRRSPAAFVAEPAWKGLSCEAWSLIFPPDFDPKGALRLGHEVTRKYTWEPASPRLPAHIVRGGLNLSVEVDLNREDDFRFNTFPARLTAFDLKVAHSAVSEQSLLSGEVMIPLLSEADPFAFQVPMTSQGFMSGYFEGIEGYRFTHNPGVAEQRVEVTVLRGVPEERERLSLTVDVSWPALDIEMKGVRYLKVWGNYNVGFYTPEGLFALYRQLNTTYRGYPVTIDAIAAGRSSGQYGFGVSGKINLGDDVSGNEGAPSFNVYSLAKNSLLPGDYKPAPKSDPAEVKTIDVEAEKAKIAETVEAEKENLLTTLDSRTAGLEGAIDAEAASLAGEWGGAERRRNAGHPGERSGQRH